MQEHALPPLDHAGQDRTGKTILRPGIDALEDSPIMEIFREGFRVPGLIALWAGEPDVPTAAFICEAASRAMAEGRTFYSDNRGTPALRAALAAYHRRHFGVAVDDARIAFTYSGMNAVMLVMQAVVSAGDTVVAVTPSWPNALRAAQINGASVRQVALSHGDDGWQLDLDQVFAACDARTRLIYLASPGNPTGWMIPPAQARALLDFCRGRRIAILADEVYHRIVYDRPVAFSFLELAQPGDPLFVVNSFSKPWAMTGWRLGWLIYPEGCTAAFEKLIQFNTSGGLEFMQAGAMAALEQGEGFVADFVARCRAGRDVVAARLAGMPRVRAIPAQGAFYAMFEVDGMRDSLAFCRRAVHEAGIGMAPGTSFGRGAETLVRLCHAKSETLLHEGMDRLEKFVAAYQEA
jgi:aspartate/methionine/tyrosine aminotransferase